MIGQIPPLPDDGQVSTPLPQRQPAPSRAEIEQLERDNDATMRHLAQQGVGIDQATAIGIRLTLLSEYLLGDLDAPDRRRFEHRVQTYYQAQLDRIESEVRRAKLLQGISLPGMPSAGGGITGGPKL